MMHIGVVGAGGVATRHMRVLSGFNDVRVVGVADPDAKRRGAMAAACGASAWPDADALLDGERLDAVYVCVPPGQHGAVEERILHAGLPMFVEKPLAADLATAERVALAAARAGVITATGYHWRHLSTVARARELLTDRPVRLAMAFWLDKMPPVPWWPLRSSCGGQMIEQGTHVLDLLRVLVGEVTSVQAAAGRDGHRGPVEDDGIDDSTAAVLCFDNGAVATVAASCLLDRKHRAGVELVATGLRLALSEESLQVSGDGVDERHEPDGDPRVTVDRCFIDAVRRGEPGLVAADYAEALRTHRVGCAIDAAARTGQPVYLAGALGSVSGTAAVPW
jgi:myo-inositol 2-dehydrogenase / D-chiro-inositol 1-dehydrogenase